MTAAKKTNRLHMLLSDQEREKLEQLAEKWDVNISEVVRMLIKRARV